MISQAFRALRRSPGFVGATVMTLVLAIGANATMFAIVDRLLLRAPVLLPDPEHVNRVYVAQGGEGKDALDGTLDYLRYVEFSGASHTVSVLVPVASAHRIIGFGEEARELPVEGAGAGLWTLFRARPVLGRVYTNADDVPPSGTAVAVLGFDYWQSAYGGRGDVVGSIIYVDAQPYTVIGVAPRDFVGLSTGDTPAVYIPLTRLANSLFGASSRYAASHGRRWLQLVMRRRPDASVAAAEGELSTIFRRSYFAERAGRTSVPAPELKRVRVVLEPVIQERGPARGSDTRVAVWLAGVALIVLIVACANVANLFLTRAVHRRQEIATRIALGASQIRVALELAIEALIIALVGGAGGLLVAVFGGRILNDLFLPETLRSSTFGDHRVLVFTIAASALTGVLIAVLPARYVVRGSLQGMLNDRAGLGGHSHRRLRAALVFVQAALSLVLLVGAGLFTRSLRAVQSLHLGYDVDPVLYIEPQVRSARLSAAEQEALRNQLLQRARALPGVEHAARVLSMPFLSSFSAPLFVPGLDSVDRLGTFDLQATSPDYFATIGTRIVRGRGLQPEDRPGAPLVVVVSEAMARRLWPRRDAIGQCLRIEADTMPCATVVGISENVKHNSLGSDAGLAYYVSITQFAPGTGNLIVRVRGEGAVHAESIRRALQAGLPGTSYISVTPFSSVLRTQISSWRTGSMLFTTFGGVALVLVAVGLFSVVGYAVTQRTHELGIRIALGASRLAILRLVFTESAIAVGGGVIVALFLVHILASSIAPLLFGVSAQDPAVLVIMPCVVLVASAVATAIPALRAIRLDPANALRAK
jgi:putative ABC transport system permease protein